MLAFSSRKTGWRAPYFPPYNPNSATSLHHHHSPSMRGSSNSHKLSQWFWLAKSQNPAQPSSSNTPPWALQLLPEAFHRKAEGDLESLRLARDPFPPLDSGRLPHPIREGGTQCYCPPKYALDSETLFPSLHASLPNFPTSRGFTCPQDLEWFLHIRIWSLNRSAFSSTHGMAVAAILNYYYCICIF